MLRTNGYTQLKDGEGSRLHDSRDLPESLAYDTRPIMGFTGAIIFRALDVTHFPS